MNSGRGRGAAGRRAASLIEISRVLEETARLVREHVPGDEADSETLPATREVTALEVRAILSLRALRRKYLGFEPSEAVWSLMLELYAARLEGKPLAEARLGIESGLPQSRALNAAARLTDNGTVVATGTDAGERRLALSDNAAERMRGYLAAAKRIAPLFA
jgi:hypothetical protein